MDPLVFEPYLRPQVWGGRRLGDQLGKALPGAGTYGEAWELSGHPHHVSRVAEGPLKGIAASNDLCIGKAWPRDLWQGPQRPVPFADQTTRLPRLAIDSSSIPLTPSPSNFARENSGRPRAWIVLGNLQNRRGRSLPG